MKNYLSALFCIFISSYCQAIAVKGRVTDDKDQPLPFATVFIKGTTTGTTTNAAGQYQLDLAPGQYTVVCQYIGFKRTELPLNVNASTQILDFHLQPVNMQIKEVVVKANGEDPAYAIIRQAIKKRHFYQEQVKEYTCMSYIKGTIGMKNVPGRFMGQKIDKKEMGVDSTGQGMIFLSESVTKISARLPDKIKLEVISSRKSGGGFGLSFPAIISFYDNNVSAVITQMGPRGYISPIAENALAYYKYRLEGTFTEEGKTVNKIQVIPRRKQEPLFSGYIFITDDDWRIHSTDLILTSEYQLELMDTLEIRQTHVPVTADIWRVKDQVMHISFNKFGFRMGGSFVNVYSDYNVHPDFPPKFFDNTFLKYDSAFDKQGHTYWDSIRPVPLETAEVKDYHEKDSIAKAARDSSFSRYHLDSLQRKQKPVKAMDVLWNGVKHKYYFRRDSSIQYHSLGVKGLLKSLKYNTVEGLVIALEPDLNIYTGEESSLRITPFLRYGLSNTHFNAYTQIDYSNRSKVQKRYGRNDWSLAGGKRVSQFNQDNPIDNIANEFYTLFLKENYMKLYENWFGKLRYTRTFQTNDRLSLGATYESRNPVENTTDFVIFKNDRKQFTPNHPYELANVPFEKHQALILDVDFTFQPGQQFVELPDRKIPFGSKYPTFKVGYSKGIPNVANSIVDFDKWSFSVQDNMNFKLLGEFRYRLGAGGFLNDRNVQIPDYQHFNGNQTFYNMKYLNSFQLAPYYQYSTTAPFYATANVEHHFNGLLTNKIPLFNRLKWNLVAGANAFYVNSDNNYVEVFGGIENILKMIRVDVVAGYQSKEDTRIGVRVGFGGILGNMVKFKN
ncbi:DUF5686 and carboxypeptidase regulatory-like domain-containing protein [Chitinophaga ginsengisegetis]|uniref:DUF5686 and carboxypeptidase regulatory-like domain-containing protein n=1 Tax=Chitinophaga ginsengisegetis TaxID=393003 RepID=UPI000DBA77ED|nr:DUF5686 and carboxypeptidase regulatory-like domain-containing protein [Chitinophaga ginsengisegetis]MDR6567641.1 hypothetical protein [Chitinophaga ginsengisegetis]MDR6647804.1 hypothetical protein [Chitinophaga ginsengisegetis]MDR6654154.1 hypothetical protein [Chitinophaga ginsengisegetis]